MTGPQFFRYKQSSVAWYQYGTGPETVLCFHGYGESGAAFSFLGKQAGDRYTFIAVDLPFHGHTNWKEGHLCTAEDLTAIIQGICPVQSFVLAGFSLGGRIALSLFNQIPEKISRMVLLAPDGLKVNFWYWLSTQTYLGNQLFAFTMKKPHWFFGLLKGINVLGLVNASIFKFVNFYIGDEKVRDLLYRRWTTMRQLKPDLRKIKKDLVNYNVNMHLVYGKHDRIILPARGEKLAAALPSHCRVSIIESGHQLLHEKHAKDILYALTHSHR